MKKIINCLLLGATLLLPPSSFSQGPPPRDGLSGEVTGGLILIDSANNLNPGSSSRFIQDLGDKPERKLSTIPNVVPEVTYRFGRESQIAWYLKTRPPIEEAGQFAVFSGFNYDLPDLGLFEAGAFYVPFRELWKNPYLVNAPRDETDVTTWGAHFAVDRLLGSKLKVLLAFLQEDVEDDDLALLFPELARDGQIYQLSLSYDILADSTFPLRPSFSLRRGEYDGDSSSFTKAVAELTGRYQAGKLSLIPRVAYSYKEYDETDPVFASTRVEHGYSFGLVANYREFLGIKSLALRGIVGYSLGDANEAFYDTESLVGGLGLVYLF